MNWGKILMIFKTLLLVFLTSTVLYAEQIQTAEYFPLTDGAWWSYSESDGPVTRWVKPGTAYVNGRATKVLQHSNGYQMYLSSNSNGIQLHKEVDPNFYIYGYGTTKATLTFSPPILYAAPVMNTGQSVHSNGNVNVSLYGLGTSTLNYSSTTLLKKEELVSVPFGTFKCFSGQNSVHVSGLFSGEWISESRTEKIWVAKGIGVIKYDDYNIGRLTDTNLEKPVEYVEISGTVQSSGSPVCAMVLANGQHMFSCGQNQGQFSLLVPLDKKGQVTLFSFCNGMVPYKQVLTPTGSSITKNISLTKDSTGTALDVTREAMLLQNGWVRLTGEVSINGQPANVLVLANGQYMFTSGSTLPLGQFQLDVPLDGTGSITLFAFSSGQPPYKETFQPFVYAMQ